MIWTDFERTENELQIKLAWENFLRSGRGKCLPLFFIGKIFLVLKCLSLK